MTSVLRHPPPILIFILLTSPNQGGKDDGNGENHDNYARYGWDDDDSDDKLGAKALKCQ